MAGLELGKFFRPIETDEEREKLEEKEKPLESITPQAAAIEVMKAIRMHVMTLIINIVALFLVFGAINIFDLPLDLFVLIVAVFWNGLQLFRSKSYYEVLERKYLRRSHGRQ